MKKWMSWILTVCLLASAPLKAFAQENAPELQTPHAAVMEVSTGELLYEKEADARVHPASVTKYWSLFFTSY